MANAVVENSKKLDSLDQVTLADDYQFTRELTPRNIILDLMGVSHPRRLESRQLSVISNIFHVPINNLRVALTRLSANGLVDNSVRGQYRLTEKGIARNNIARRWRNDGRKSKHWDGGWLACHLPKGEQRSVRQRSLKVLDWFGFQPGLDQMWIRPNNLSDPLPDLRFELKQLGLEPAANLFVLERVEDTVATGWTRLWPTKMLDQSYATLSHRLNKSLSQLEKADANTSLIETCLLGSEAIHRLATDPLLPKEIRNESEYKKLHSAMMKYDRIGRKIWIEQLKALGVYE